MTDYIDTVNPRPPVGSDFGQGMNYALWTPNTEATLCKVPWNNDYRDIVQFANDASLVSYLKTVSSNPITITRMTYARVGDPIRINLPFNEVYRYNYIMVQNPANPIGAHYYDESGNHIPMSDAAKNYYYFITDVRYIAPNTTELSVQLDVWQTFGYDISFGNCYIERGHIGIANSNAFANNGLDYLTVPEGFDLGSDYMPLYQWKTDIMSVPALAGGSGPPYTPSDPLQPAILVVSTTDLEASWGDLNNPNLQTAPASPFNLLPNGAGHYVFHTEEDYLSFMIDIGTAPWVSQGIIGIYAIPQIPTDSTSLSQTQYNNGASSRNAPMYRMVGGTFGTSPGSTGPGSHPTTLTAAAGFRSVAQGLLPSRYQGLTKFLTSPYLMLEMTTYHGQPIVLKPELIATADLQVNYYQHLSMPNPQLTFVPLHYASGGVGSFDDGEFMDLATSISNFPQFSLVNNSYLNYMASNTHRIGYAYSLADWSQQKALSGNSVRYAQASAAIDTNNAITHQQNLYEIGSTAANRATSIGNSFLDLLNPVKDLTGSSEVGLLKQITGTGNDVAQTTLSINQRDNINNLNQNLNAFNRDTNKSYADAVAKGDYSADIMAIQAKVQDSKLIQPTTSGQVGGEAALLVNYGWKLIVKLKMINANAVHNIGEYWLRFGYTVNRFHDVSQLQVMTHFTYWKMTQTYITQWSCPESFKNTIRGIFEKGVTVWSNPADIGTIDTGSNTAQSGITL
jgi:hypothetical protein